MIDNKQSTIAGIAFGKGSLAIARRVKAATNIVTASKNPAITAAIGNQIPANNPIADAISINPVKKLKMGGMPKRLNSSAILPEIILLPVNIKNNPIITCKMIITKKIPPFSEYIICYSI